MARWEEPVGEARTMKLTSDAALLLRLLTVVMTAARGVRVGGGIGVGGASAAGDVKTATATARGVGGEGVSRAIGGVRAVVNSATATGGGTVVSETAIGTAIGGGNTARAMQMKLPLRAALAAVTGTEGVRATGAGREGITTQRVQLAITCERSAAIVEIAIGGETATGRAAEIAIGIGIAEDAVSRMTRMARRGTWPFKKVGKEKLEEKLVRVFSFGGLFVRESEWSRSLPREGLGSYWRGTACDLDGVSGRDDFVLSFWRRFGSILCFFYADATRNSMG